MNYAPIDELKSRLSFDFELGKVYWKVPPVNHPRLAGKEAGCVVGKNHPGTLPYWVISFGWKSIKRSRMIFAAAHGYWPRMVDHRDGNSLNDSLPNLREATPSENSRNIRSRTKRSGLPLGVSKTKQGKFMARLCYADGFSKSLGVFDTPDLAYRRYMDERRSAFGEFSGGALCE